MDQIVLERFVYGFILALIAERSIDIFAAAKSLLGYNESISFTFAGITNKSVSNLTVIGMKKFSYIISKVVLWIESYFNF